jgi:hypothetical protein
MPNFLLAASVAVTQRPAGGWWEPGTPGFLDIGDLSAILGFLIALSGVVVAVLRWWLKLLKGIIREEIQKATEPIHPAANGGLSLADVARKTNKLEEVLQGVVNHQQENRLMLTQLVAGLMLANTEEDKK